MEVSNVNKTHEFGFEEYYDKVNSNGKTWNKRTSDLLYKNPYFFVITRLNQMGSSLNVEK